MADILNITGLGRLEIVETYVYYDQPVLFSCKSAAGHLYLAWLLIKTTSMRFSTLESPLNASTSSDLAQLTSTMHLPCLKIAFYIIPYDDQTQPRMEPIEPDQISEDMLPMPGECLNLETKTLPAFIDSKIQKTRNSKSNLNFDGSEQKRPLLS